MVIPAPTRIYDHQPNAFTPGELDALERHCDALALTKAGLNSPTQDPRYDDVVRVTHYASVHPAPDIMWFYQRMADIVAKVNLNSYHYDLRGFAEPPQFMVYRDSEGGHFDWHFDTGPLPPRKLSLTVQLTDPARYEGGVLQFNLGNSIVTAPRDRGTAIAFPSYMIHRVTPVTAGIRKAIVAWVTGPAFK